MKQPKDFAKDLVRAHGYDYALRIALKSADAVKSENHANLPTGEVFFSASKKASKASKLSAMHSFWVNVVGCIKKSKSVSK